MRDYLAIIDWECPIGGTFDQDISITTTDGTFDLSDYTAEADIVKNDEVIESFTCTVTNDSVKLFLTPTQTAAIEKGNYSYDIKITNSLDPTDVQYPIGGTIRFESVFTK